MRSSLLPVALAAALVLPLLPGVASSASAQRGSRVSAPVTLHRDLDFTGRAEGFGGDDADLRNNPIGDDSATSVRVRRGCRVRLYAHPDYRGAYVELRRDAPDLRRLEPVLNDRVSSLRVRCASPYDFDPPPLTLPRDNRPPRGGGYGDRDDRWDRPLEAVTLYRDLDFTGRREGFDEDVSDLRGSYIGDDEATSVQVARRCRARLYEHPNFRGRFIELDGGDDERDLRRSPIRDDSISSLRVRCGRDLRKVDWDAPIEGVTLYRDLRFSGRAETFVDDIPDLRGTYIGNDEVTSARVARGCRVRLYEHPDFRGDYTELRNGEDAPDLRGSRVGDDRISSLEIRCRRDRDDWYGGGYDDRDDDRYDRDDAAVTLYRDPQYRGRAESFDEGDIPDLRGSYVGNDEVTSVRVARGCRVRLYEHTNFRGDYTELRNGKDDPDLRGSRVGDDRISSLQVRCRGRDRWN
ncbi:MAG: beta/gamma crystallin-related protein [Acidobacteriota bacterium]